MCFNAYIHFRKKYSFLQFGDLFLFPVLEKDEGGMILGTLIKYLQIDDAKIIIKLTHDDVLGKYN